MNSRRVKTLCKLLFTAMFLWSSHGYAVSNAGTSGAQFLKIGPGARVDSLGGAFGAIANDVTAIYWNPAGLSQLTATSVSGTHTVWLADTRYNFLAFATPVEKIGTLGASVTVPLSARYGNHNAGKAGWHWALVLRMGCGGVNGLLQTTVRKRIRRQALLRPQCQVHSPANPSGKRQGNGG